MRVADRPHQLAEILAVLRRDGIPQAGAGFLGLLTAVHLIQVEERLLERVRLLEEREVLDRRGELVLLLGRKVVPAGQEQSVLPPELKPPRAGAYSPFPDVVRR